MTMYMLDRQLRIKNVVVFDRSKRLLQDPIAHHARSQGAGGDAEVAKLSVSLGAKGIGDLYANLRHAVFQLHDLGGHEIRVIAAGEGEKDVRFADSGLLEDIVGEAAAEHDVAVMVLTEPSERGRILL